MGLDFLHANGGHRMDHYTALPPMFDPAEGEEVAEEVDLAYEDPAERWQAKPPYADTEWCVRAWAERPGRFIDGKDVGATIAWLQSPLGQPVPVRLSEIGAISVRVEEGQIRREVAVVERVVSMVADVFPWDEVEAFAAALQDHGYRFLPAHPPAGKLSFDFEHMRKAAQNRSNDEMGVLEEGVLAGDDATPVVVDGRLEPRHGAVAGLTAVPAIGVIKTHREIYLHEQGMSLLHRLAPGERTPLFALGNIAGSPSRSGPGSRDGASDRVRLPVVSWYLRLSGTAGAMPNWGIVRVELPRRWFEPRRHTDGFAYVDQLCRALCAYRTSDSGYGRAAVSLHPIVRAEELLGALFTPGSLLGNRFCRLTGI